LLQVPGDKYDRGYNTSLGDKNILWKFRPDPVIRALRKTPRDLEVAREEIKKLKAASMQ